VIARECLPAVVGVEHATRLIRTGSRSVCIERTATSRSCTSTRRTSRTGQPDGAADFVATGHVQAGLAGPWRPCTPEFERVEVASHACTVDPSASTSA
jgi:hypothetical protein